MPAVSYYAHSERGITGLVFLCIPFVTSVWWSLADSPSVCLRNVPESRFEHTVIASEGQPLLSTSGPAQ